jgi:hypothetical protein
MRTWKIRLEPRPDAPPERPIVVDAETGEDVSNQFPLRTWRRLKRSWATGEPVRIALFLLGADGRAFVVHQRQVKPSIAAVPRRVVVVR